MQQKKILKNQLTEEQNKVAKDVLDKTITEYEKKLISVKEGSKNWNKIIKNN